MIVVEEGEAFDVNQKGWLEFLARRAAGENVSIASFGIGVGDYLGDAMAITAADAAEALRRATKKAGVARAA